MHTAASFSTRLSTFSSARYKQLHDHQILALEGYQRHHDASDVAIELPTGYGKTLIALLLADLGLETGWRVAYLTGNNQLADQVLAHAADLPGLDAVKFSSRNYPPAALARYHDALAVGVMNYWTYFNTSPKMEPADLLIFDDAHLAEQPLAQLFSIRVDRRSQRPLYEQFCDLVTAHTDAYSSIELMRNGLAGPTTPPELLSFTHWGELSDAAAQLLAAGLPDNARRFTWPNVRPQLNMCGVLIGPSAVEIRPYHPPSRTIHGFGSAKQRLYLSATLGTIDDLQRRLGLGPVISVLDDPVAAGAVGERIFIVNPGDEPAVSDVPMTFALEQADRAGRAAWLCASHAEADQVEEALRAGGRRPYRLQAGGDDDALVRWAGDATGQLVTAGRYDGLDLAGDLCRLVILPSVPAASSEFERFVMAYLGDATFMRHRVGQRVTQALGRANRESGDWAMYLGLAPTFGTLLAQSAVQSAIPADVKPTIDAALVRASDGWSTSGKLAADFWRAQRDAGVGTTPPTRPRPGRRRAAATAGTASDEVEAVVQLWLGDPSRAAEAASRAATALVGAGELEHAAFWRYVEAQAHYVSSAPGSSGRSIDALVLATDVGATTGWIVRLRRILAELRGQQATRTDDAPCTQWDEWINEAGIAGIKRALARGQQSLAGSHDARAEALELLGRVCGVQADRPTGNSVTDATWAWASGRRAERRLWEVKTGTPDKIPRDWVDQALGQVMADRTARVHSIGCILSDRDAVEAESAAAAKDDLCLVHHDAAVALLTLMSDRLTAYLDLWGSGSAAERGAARSAVEARLPPQAAILATFGPSGGRIVRRADVLAIFRDHP